MQNSYLSYVQNRIERLKAMQEPQQMFVLTEDGCNVLEYEEDILPDAGITTTMRFLRDRAGLVPYASGVADMYNALREAYYGDSGEYLPIEFNQLMSLISLDWVTIETRS